LDLDLKSKRLLLIMALDLCIWQEAWIIWVWVLILVNGERD